MNTLYLGYCLIVTCHTLTLDTLTIRQDYYGRYCLNDLHEASGGAAHHQPSKFFANDSTQALILEMLKSPKLEIKPFESKKGKGGGTFAVRQLVYRYAMWISPQFHLKVIRAYDRLATQGAYNAPTAQCRI